MMSHLDYGSRITTTHLENGTISTLPFLAGHQRCVRAHSAQLERCCDDGGQSVRGYMANRSQSVSYTQQYPEKRGRVERMAGGCDHW